MRTLLYTGHRLDASGRPEPRFPADCTDAMQRAIASLLDLLEIDSGDHAIGSGADGADLLWAQALLVRGATLHLWLPFEEEAFVLHCVHPGGPRWLQRWDEVQKAAATCTSLPLDPVTPLVYQRLNRLMLDEAFARSATPVLLAVWNRGRGDGPGGTEDLVMQTRMRGGRVHVLDPRRICGGNDGGNGGASAPL